MSAVAEASEVFALPGLTGKGGFTAAILASLPDKLVGHPVRWELWDGRLVALSPSNDVHGIIGNRIGTELELCGERTGLGLATGETTILFVNDEEESVLAPDATFRLFEQEPKGRTPQGYLLVVPVIVAEVRSPTNRPREIAEKIQRYLAGGAKLVWDIDPRHRQVTIHRPGEEPEILNESDTLTAVEILPQLAIPLQRLFGNLGW